MRLKYTIPDHIDDEPIVPDDLRRELEQRWVGCYSLTICRLMADESEPSLNSISLVCKKEHDTPKDDFDEVSVAVLRIMLAHADEARADMPGGGRIQFRVYCYRRTESKTSRKKTRFNYIIQLDAEGGFEDSSSYMSPAEMDHMRMQMQLESEQGRNSALIEVIANDREWQDKMLGRLLEMTTLSNQAIEPLQKLMAYMGSVALSGWQTSYANMSQMFDHKQIEAEMRYKKQRSDKLFGMLGPLLAKAKEQFEAHQAKAGANGKSPSIIDSLVDAAAQGGDEEEEEVEVDDADVAAATTVTMQSGGGNGEDPDDPLKDLSDEEKEEPMASIARHIGTLIRPDQWFEIMEAMRKPELKLLRAVFGSDTDADFFVAWDSLNKRVDKIAVLWTILDAEQQETLTQLQSAVDAVRAEAE